MLLSRAGNRQLNHAMAICQISHDTAGWAYYQRKLGERQVQQGSLAMPQAAVIR
jgi:hypothetical protein